MTIAHWASRFAITILICTYPAVLQGEISNEVSQNHVMFPRGGTALDEQAQVQIAKLGQILNMAPFEDACLKLVGYADQSGGARANLRISQQRADRVAETLRPLLSHQERIVQVDAVGAEGFLTGISPTDPNQRRVAIFARKCEFEFPE